MKRKILYAFTSIPCTQLIKVWKDKGAWISSFVKSK